MQFNVVTSFLKKISIIHILTFVLFSAGTYLLASLIKEFFFTTSYYRGNHHDFLAFYGAAKFALQGHIADVYDMAKMTAFQRTIIDHAVGAQGYMPYLNPPAIATILSPLALVPLFAARNMWFFINLCLIIGVSYWLVYKLTRTSVKILLVFLLVTTFPVYQNLLQGQLSILILAGLLLAMWFGQKNKPIQAGICLSLLLIKPQFGVMVMVGLIIAKQWKALVAMAASIAALIIAFLPFTGISLYFTYIRFMGGVASSHVNGAGAITESVWQGRLSYTVGINGLYTSIFGQDKLFYTNFCTAITISALLMLFAFALRRARPGFKNYKSKLLFIAGICLMLLVDPHAYSQDALLLYTCLPILLSMRKRSSTVVAFLCFMQLNMIDQNKPIHLVTLSLILIVVAVCVDVIKNSQNKSIFSKYLH